MRRLTGLALVERDRDQRIPCLVAAPASPVGLQLGPLKDGLRAAELERGPSDPDVDLSQVDMFPVHTVRDEPHLSVTPDLGRCLIEFGLAAMDMCVERVAVGFGHRIACNLHIIFGLGKTVLCGPIAVCCRAQVQIAVGVVVGLHGVVEAPDIAAMNQGIPTRAGAGYSGLDLSEDW